MGAEQVGVVLGEAADPGQARQLARLLVAVDRAELGQPQRQVAIAARLRGVDLDVVRAVHRLEQVLLEVAGLLEVADALGDAHLEERPGHTGRLLAIGSLWISGSRSGMPALPSSMRWASSSRLPAIRPSSSSLAAASAGILSGRELRVLVVGIVAAGLVELDLADVRGVDRLVAALDQLVLDEGLEDAADDRPLGHPEDQARPDQRRDREQVQLLAEPAMVALLGLFDLGEVGVEVLLVEERGAVDALEHLAVGLPLPVGPGDREQLERADLAGVGDVRAAAEVDELALAVEAEDAVLVQLVVDVLDLERLAQVGDELAGLGDRQA